LLKFKMYLWLEGHMGGSVLRVPCGTGGAIWHPEHMEEYIYIYILQTSFRAPSLSWVLRD
jgi:hypothetical protein